MNKYGVIGAFGIVLVGGIALWVMHTNTKPITSFEECAKRNPVMESYPRKCASDGAIFTENIGNELEKQELIRNESPRPNTTITSPLSISGEARGYWFFEASFPIELQDAAGNTLAESYATAQSSWMTEDFVPYTANLTFSAPAGTKGLLILRKDNPSGDPERDDSLRIPVSF